MEARLNKLPKPRRGVMITSQTSHHAEIDGDNLHFVNYILLIDQLTLTHDPQHLRNDFSFPNAGC